MQLNPDKEQQASELRSSLLDFTKFFFKYLTGREFIVSMPISRESHHITVCRELTKIQRLEILREIINLPPGSGKSTLVSMFAAWCWASYPDSNFLYISYSHELAVKHTAFIRSIVSSRAFQYLFDVNIDPESRAKDSFKTMHGGSIKAFGSGGAITGQDAGLPGLDRFSGAVIIDDAHKPDEAHSDTIRQGVIHNYDETIRQRCRGQNVPIIYIGQRVHEADLTDFLTSGKDVDPWNTTILKGLDGAGNALYPEMMPKEKLLALQDKSPYVFASQYQQDPLPAGGGLFKPDWFVFLPQEPEILRTFITADTAETNKSWNDATSFSFWGVYDIETMGRRTGELGLHWLDCVEVRIEPKDLKTAFLDFYAHCTLHQKPPLMAAIEKKSTGVTLVSILQELRGLQIREIERTKASGSKTQRFLEIQPYIASKRISFTDNAKHADMCIAHMSKITANDSHRHDDICFVRGTKIATTIGNVNIEDITIQHKIITPFGIGSVKSCGSTGFRKVIKNLGLEGTYDHPVFYKNDFYNLDTLTDVSDNSRFTLGELIKWKYLKLLFLMGPNIILQERKDITLAAQKKIVDGKVLKDFMLRFGNFIAVKRYPELMLFIIKMAIVTITTLKIWSVFHVRNMLANTWKKGLKKIHKIFMPLWIKQEKQQKYGMPVKRDDNGIQKMPIQVCLNLPIEPALSVIYSTKEYQSRSTVHVNVTTLNMQKEPEINEQKKEVFNLTVENYGVYYANGILVSNCDTISDAIKIALIEKTLYHLSNKQDEAQKQMMSGMTQNIRHKLKLGQIRYGRNGKNPY